MRLFAVVLGFGFSVCLYAFPPLHIVLDMDDVLFFLMPSVVRDDAHHLSVTLPEPVGEVSYRVADGASAFVHSLELLPGARVSFFSTAPGVRNTALLQKLIVQPVGSLSAYDLADFVFSRNDIARTAVQLCMLPFCGGLDPSVFPEAQEGNAKKDLRLVAGDDLSNTILIDDNNYSAMKEQIDSLMWLPTPLDDAFWNGLTKRKSFPESIDALLGDLVAAGQVEQAKIAAQRYFEFRNQLFYARGLLQKAVERAHANSVSVPSVLKEMQWELRGSQYLFNRTMRGDLSIYRRGLEMMRRVRPDISLHTVEAHGIKYPNCAAEVQGN